MVTDASDPAALAAERGSVLLYELGDGSRRPAREISDGIGDRDCFAACALIGADRENALDDGGRNAFSNAARPCVLWRLIDKAHFLANDRADDLRSWRYDIASLPVSTYFLPRCPG